jgi:hypothetical protein
MRQHSKGPEDVATALLHAAALIREKGHCKGSYWSDHGMCIVGALIAARASIDVFAALKKQTGTERIIDWNDAPERTTEEVIAALEGAAASCKSADAICSGEGRPILGTV